MLKPGKRRFFYFVGVLVLVLLLGILIINQFAPATTQVNIMDCVRRDDACLQLPMVTGTNLSGESLTFPTVFAGDLNLVVMPFDREQQMRAIEFVPLFQELAAQSDSVAYYSIAALPDLSAPIRLLVSGGMQAAVNDPAIRAVTALLYLENQAAFIEALAVPDVSTIQVFIFNQAGEVLWQTSGDYDESLAADLREKLAVLLN